MVTPGRTTIPKRAEKRESLSIFVLTTSVQMKSRYRTLAG